MAQLQKKDAYNVAIAGATGAVGETFLQILEERNFPIAELRLLASKRSVGKTLKFKGKDYTVQELTHDSFKDIDIALFSAGGGRSLEFAPSAVKAGAVVVDNSSAYRMDDEVPLVVPEVNPQDAFKHKGIIANPNCTTIIMVVALQPLHAYSRIKKVVVSSYQSSSGAGAQAMQELMDQTKAWAEGKEIKAEKFANQLLFNVFPHIDSFTANGYTKEEMKMFNETRKIMGDKDIKVSATCVRVPVLSAHSEAVTVETEKEITPELARELFSKAPGLIVKDNPEKSEYPMPLYVAGQDDCYVGRIRKDISADNTLSFWVVGDQLRKGAATNAVQIAELLIK
ncbi:aspartate-semialdehyde dehydrogenase [Geovibrio thiophilus]|uniref:Aspartate-semialdehyde dehydrogenase n=1 Tax=Geovibrio thiophilus TaxID=139438 RepID=A0A3R6AYA4_9BACT|nr:aspartate-semialdehyde dehydrogenase [Geovibrio thiophilus]QAR33325.1 aspartate-semialdehyde dehydrogenase [Geovibrio thiophilus]